MMHGKPHPQVCHDHMPSLVSYVASRGQHQSDKRIPALSVRGSVNHQNNNFQQLYNKPDTCKPTHTALSHNVLPLY